MNKIKIMPQVTVYQNVFSDEDIKFLLEEIYKSENNISSNDSTDPNLSSYLDYHGPQPEDKGDGSLIYTWKPWYTYGSKSIWSSPNNNTLDKKQQDGYNLIHKAIVKVHDDYIKDWKNQGAWTYDIDNWDLDTNHPESLSLSTLEILKHRINNETDYTIHVHIDWHEQRKDEPGPKQILTYTIYLNDEYEGGEVDFVDEENLSVMVYKPKKGDITIFPAGRPYWHGARAVKSEPNKVFIRTFALYRSRGTKEWNDGIRDYGVARWLDMKKNDINSHLDDGKGARQLVYDGQVPNDDENSLPLYIKSETYIDGRSL